MVVLSPSFTLLASLSAIAAVSFLPAPVDGAAIPSPVHHGKEKSNHEPYSRHGTNGGTSTTPDANANDPQSADSSSAPIIPLPIRSMKAADNGSSHFDQNDKRSWDPMNTIFEVRNVWIRDELSSRNHVERDSHDKVVVTGDNDHVHVHDGHHHHGQDTVIVKGHNDHVHAHRRSPRSHHHHGSHDRVIVTGDHDHVNVHTRRSGPGLSIPLLNESIPVPQLGRRDHHHHHHHSNSHDKVVVSGDNDHVNVHMRRDDPFEAEGVPGTIDIMSSVAGSSLGERIASLKLSPTLGDDVYGSSDPFILSASEVNQTQVYMVAMPSNDSDNSNTTTSSNSTDPASFRRVALTIPLFNAEEAMMKSYCATFDAKPSAPSPLTMERCTNGTTTDEHKSQVFAYDPNTGSIQPMWFDGEDDGMTDDGDEGGEDDPSMDAPNNSTETAPVDPSTDADATVARIANLDEKLLDSTFGDATRPASFVAFAKSFAQDSGYPNAQNVTLVFTPAAPEVIPQAAAEEKLAGEASAASPTDAAATASDSVAVTSDSVSTTITFSAASAAATSLSSSSVTDILSTSVAPSSTSDDSAIAADVPSSSASGISTTPLSATTSAASTHGLDVEVYDPDATASGVASTSSATISSVSPTRSDLASDSLDAQAASSTASTSTSSASTMTPVSTAPYEWMFKEGLAKSS